MSTDVPDAPRDATGRRLAKFGLHVPDDYILNDKGIFRVEPTKGGDARVVPIGPMPFFICGYLEDIDSKAAKVNLTWRATTGRWVSKVFPREDVLRGGELAKLSGYGLPVTSGKASKLADFLLAFEVANRDVMPIEFTTEHFGWQRHRDERVGFLVGDAYYSLAGEQRVMDVRFAPKSEGLAQVAHGLTRRGSLSAWTRALTPLANYPKVLVGLYASFVPVVLDILHAPNFAVDYSNLTSTGKTSALMLIASAHGNANMREPEHIIVSWNTTRVGLERYAAVRTDLPMLMDDTKQAKKREDVGQMLYDIAGGQGRVRGSPEGMRETQRWRTVLISTGERRITTFTNDNGTRARTLCLTGIPFGSVSEDIRDDIRAMVDGVLPNGGNALAAFVEYVCDHPDEWETWRDGYVAERARCEEVAGAVAKREGDAVISRLVECFAAASYTGQLVHEALGTMGRPLYWDYDDVRDALDEVLREIVREVVGEGQSHIRALHDAMDWATANNGSFIGRERYDSNRQVIPPSGGWLGLWDEGGEDEDWEEIAFYQVKLKEYLERLDYSYDEVLTAWKAADIVALDKKRQLVSRSTAGVGKQRMVVFKREVLESAGILQPTSSAPTPIRPGLQEAG